MKLANVIIQTVGVKPAYIAAAYIVREKKTGQSGCNPHSLSAIKTSEKERGSARRSPRTAGKTVPTISREAPVILVTKAPKTASKGGG